MSEQLSLRGFEEPAPLTDRLFFALLPDADSVTRIASLQQQLRTQHGLKSTPVSVDRLHATLFFLGDFAGLPQQLVAKAVRAASSLEFPLFEVRFDYVLSFSGNPRGRPLVLRGGDGLQALTEFQQVLAMAMSKEGLKPADKTSFTPHLTLLYDPRAMAEQPIEPISWTVREFVLVRSAIGQSRYEIFARWPLR